jgi:hypothetical protein
MRPLRTGVCAGEPGVRAAPPCGRTCGRNTAQKATASCSELVTPQLSSQSHHFHMVLHLYESLLFGWSAQTVQDTTVQENRLQGCPSLGRFAELGRIGLGSVCDRVGIGLGSRFGIGLGSVWCRFGIALGSPRAKARLLPIHRRALQDLPCD